jgi:hypothetical protein
MVQAFHDKLSFVLKVLSISRGRLAAELNVDKSIVGRWMRGLVRPSDDNLARLTALVTRRVPAFTIIDWDRDAASLAKIMGVDPETAPGAGAAPLGGGLRQEIFDQILETTGLRGDAYQGLYRSTRPYASQPGVFLHDHLIVRREASGLLGFVLVCDEVTVEGWVLPQQSQIFVLGAENVSGSLSFGIFNGVNGPRADVVDGLMLSCALDAGRTPTATAMILERIGHLTGDREADDRRFGELAARPGLAAPGSVPDDLVSHLLRDIGPAQLMLGGDLLLRLPLARSLTRGARLV